MAQDAANHPWVVDEINIRFFATGHRLIGMGHDRATSVQSAIGDAIFRSPQALSRSAVQQARLSWR